jgi:hypothetical protein
MKSLLAIDDSKYSVAATQTVIRQFHRGRSRLRARTHPIGSHTTLSPRFLGPDKRGGLNGSLQH